MRFLIISAAILACAAAAPSGALLAASYAHGLGAPYAHGLAAPYAHGLVAAPLAVAHAPLAPALPTISPGDLQGAAIDAHVDASDHARAAVDAAREYHDQAAELQGRAINAAEDHSWQAVDAVKTAEAQLDGAAAGAAPVLAKSLVAPQVYAAPAVLGHGYGAPAAYAAAPALLGHGYAAPALGVSKSVVTQSLSQSHPAPVYHSAPVAYAAHAAPLAYAAHAAPLGYAAHGLHAW